MSTVSIDQATAQRLDDSDAYAAITGHNADVVASKPTDINPQTYESLLDAYVTLLNKSNASTPPLTTEAGAASLRETKSLRARISEVCENNINLTRGLVETTLLSMETNSADLNTLRSQIADLVTENAKVAADKRDKDQGYKNREAERQRLQGIVDGMVSDNSLQMINLQDKMDRTNRWNELYGNLITQYNRMLAAVATPR